MKSVTSSEAKAKLTSLLRQVERGEEVVITRRGVPVARIARVRRSLEKPSKRIAAVVDEMLAYRDRAKRTLGSLSARQLIEEGRRF